ncbi:MAG: rod shape-determining protein RodA [Alphaproteobacteria bacterium]|nr:rod shape-determining protein RodA [Alphaproteobacteria bacterium]
MPVIPSLTVNATPQGIREKLRNLHWGLIFTIIAITSIGIVMLYSASGGSFEPWANKQIIRFGIGLLIMLGIALIDLRLLLKHAYSFYILALILLVAVLFIGEEAKGARRWIDIGSFQLQPSEIMKIALILALAKYFHGYNFDNMNRPIRLIITLILPGILILIPTFLIEKQPDMGTAGMLALSGVFLLFAVGIPMWIFISAGAVGLILITIFWNVLFHGYQKDRILTFLDPESNPLGTGYHIIQSKIAIGSGGLFGKGYLQGTQSHLDFLPERHTDFIFTMLAEEFGLIGGVTVIVLFGALIFIGHHIATQCRNHFGRVLCMGLTVNIFLYVFINTAMVMGLIPVVGVPLPLVSYGGTAMMTVLVGFGLMLSVYIHRNTPIGRRGSNNDEL